MELYIGLFIKIRNETNLDCITHNVFGCRLTLRMLKVNKSKQTPAIPKKTEKRIEDVAFAKRFVLFRNNMYPKKLAARRRLVGYVEQINETRKNTSIITSIMSTNSM